MAKTNVQKSPYHRCFQNLTQNIITNNATHSEIDTIIALLMKCVYIDMVALSASTNRHSNGTSNSFSSFI